ncbi:Orexin receptor type 1 [Tupaia chinensis]|uniref:Orexin/Hypocretin receptor type 1 n=1 Tax=Tupaia chinensis TaxID=246437 RepID=L9JDH9_TUPCH|nr:Orexin receptor type 1 [Tupaia chinensis]
MTAAAALDRDESSPWEQMHTQEFEAQTPRPGCQTPGSLRERLQAGPGSPSLQSPGCPAAAAAPELMEPSATPAAQTGVPTGSEEPSPALLDYDDQLLLYLWRDYLYPKQYEWVLIAAYVAVFLVALVGNALVCLAVWQNQHMRTVTNYFIVNLSLADVLVTAICLPASLLVDITESWLFGPALCKVIPYLQEPSPALLDYDDQLLLYLWRDYLYPKQYEWVLIAAYVAVFLVALVGNALVCLAVWQNQHMRTVTNYFIVNLSLADVLVTAICLPASLLVDITESWLFGPALCKVIPYLQAVSVSVAVLTLSFIALDRWYAICHPLLFRSMARRARGSILGIWAVSLAIMMPQAAVMECRSMLPELANRTRLFSICDEHWADDLYPKIYHSCFFIVTYLAPLGLMAMAYFQIFRRLWGRQSEYLVLKGGSLHENESLGSRAATPTAACVPQVPGTASALVRDWTWPSARQQEPRPRAQAFLAEVKQMRARRKTAKMLMVVLLVFALCYLPISVLNVLKRVFGMFRHAHDREAVYACFTLSHWLVYANSAANPVIYSFLSGKFREQFKAAFSCCLPSLGPCGSLKAPSRRTSARHKSLSPQSRCSVSRVSEHVVLTGVTTVLP